MKKLIISGINLVDGGALSVFHDCLDSLIKSSFLNIYDVTILVGKKSLFKKYSNSVSIIEFPKSKKNWLYRLYYEYFYFKKLSKKWQPDIWISLHDITPNVVAKKRFVYCHNPSPFNKMSIKEAKYGLKYYLFSKFYKFLYQINICKNDAVIVQQDWIRKDFIKLFNPRCVIVARPSMPPKVIENLSNNQQKDDNKKIFLFPSYPRYYKNFEVACEACNILHQQNIDDYILYITINGSENLYSRELVKQYSKIPNIRFIGILDRIKLYDLYKHTNCLIFMSKLETWGMPIIEFKTTNKSMILADLPYAHETVGNYQKVAFAKVDDYDKVANFMKTIINGQELTDGNVYFNPIKPYASNWDELLNLLLN